VIVGPYVCHSDGCESFKSSFIKIHPLQLQDLQGVGSAPAFISSKISSKNYNKEIWFGE